MKKNLTRIVASLLVALMLMTSAPVAGLADIGFEGLSLSAQAASVGTVSKVVATQSTSAVKLTWSKATNATGYYIYIRQNSSWTAKGKTTGTACTIKNLKAGAKYTFAVRPYNLTNGKVTWASSFKTISTATQPAAPSKVVSTQNASAIKLTWAKVSGATGYRIFYKSGSSWKVLVKATAKTTYTITGRAAGSRYTFAVRPYIKTDSGYVWGSYTQHDTATTPAAPKTIGAVGTTTVALSWNAVKGATGYRIFCRTSSSASWKVLVSSTTATYSNIKGLNANKTYQFAVRPYIKTSSAVIWGTYTPIALKTNSSFKYQKYEKVFSSGEFTMKIKDNELGNATIAVKDGNLFTSAEMEGMTLKLVYQKAKGEWFIIIDSLKAYCPCPDDIVADMNPEDLTGGVISAPSSVITTTVEIINGKKYFCERCKDSSGRTVKYYYSGNTLVRSDVTENDGTVTTTIFSSISQTADDSLFEIPKGYIKWNIDWLLSMMG